MTAETELPDVAQCVRDGQVHRDVFTSKGVFRLEMERLFARCWIYVGHESQIPNPGDYYASTVGDQPVIMVRHKDGTIHVLYNRCPHRGVELVNEGHGSVGPMFRCPYHAWTFKTDGTLRGIPVKQGYDAQIFAGCEAAGGMTKVTSHVYRQFVFARLEDDGIDFDEYFGDALSSIDNMVDRSPFGRLEVVGRPLRYMHHCNWKMPIENLTDTFHPMIAHESSAGTVKRLWEKEKPQELAPMLVEVALPFTSPHDFYVKMGIRTWPNGHGHTGVEYSIHSDYKWPEEYIQALEGVHGKEKAGQVLAEARHNTVYFPNMTIKGAVQVLRLAKPIAPNKTLVESWLFRLVGAPEELLERSALYNRLINSPTSIVGHDDLEMYERAQRGLAGRANPWVNYQREMKCDEALSGEQTWSGQSEVQMRNQYQAWTKFMSPENREGGHEHY